MEKLYEWLKKFNQDSNGKVNAPMLLIDDEADNASVNTRKEDDTPTAINKSIRMLLSLFTHSNYVAFTAKDEMRQKFPDEPVISGFVDRDYQEGEKKEYNLAFWKRTSKDGKTRYLSGKVGNDYIVAFYDDKHATYNVFLQGKDKTQPKADIKNEELPF